MQGSSRDFWFAGVMMGLLAMEMTGASAQELPDPMDFGVVYEELAFEAADTDGNNLVDEGEFARDAAAAFSGLDAERDGKLTPQELELRDASGFTRIDANSDGVLTFKEVMTFKMKAFGAADKNQDGALSFDEMVDAVRSEVVKQ
jgi:Ca2+-binding EF-hand superfamily protein